MYNLDFYGLFEKKIISTKDRFKLNAHQAKQIKNRFLNSNILIAPIINILLFIIFKHFDSS